MAPTIIKPEDALFTKSLTFGPAGHGKTTLLGTAQDDKRTAPMLLLDFEGGVKSLAGKDIDVAPIRGWDDFNEVYEYLTSDESKYRSIGIDSISEIQIFGFLAILEKEADNRKDPDRLQQDDYGKILIQLRRLVRAFRDLPLHVFITALSKEETDIHEGLVKKHLLAGAFAEEILGIMDVVSYLALSTTDEGETQRVLLLKNYPKVRVKVRTPWGKGHLIPDEVVNPTVGRLLDALEGKLPPIDKDQPETTGD